MNARQFIYRKLSASPVVALLVGTKIYPSQVVNKSLPYVSFFRVSLGRNATLQGSRAPFSPRFQLDVWGSTQQEADDISDAVFAALNDYSGTFAGFKIQWSAIDDARDLPDEPVGGEELPAFRNNFDLVVHHS